MILSGLLVDLVPFDARFAKLAHRWENGPAGVWSEAGRRTLWTHSMIDRLAERRCQWQADHPGQRVGFGIQAKDGTPIGRFHLGHLSARHRWAVLGAQIGEPDYWGGGYGTDALLLALDYGFDWLDLRKIWLETISLNARVGGQMRKVGFRLEARQRQAAYIDGEWGDMLAFGLLRQEWPGRATMIEQLGLRATPEEV